MNYPTRRPTAFEAGPQHHGYSNQHQHDASASVLRMDAMPSQSYCNLEVNDNRPQHHKYPTSSSSSTSSSSLSSRHHPYSRSKPDGIHRRAPPTGQNLLPPTPIIRKNTARGAPYHPIYKQVVSGGNTYSIQLPSPPGPVPLPGHEDQHSLTLPPLAFGFERARFSVPSPPRARNVLGSHARANAIDQRPPLGPYPGSLESQPQATHTRPYDKVAHSQRGYDGVTPGRPPSPEPDNLVEEVIEEGARDLVEKRQFDPVFIPAYPFERYGDDSDDDMDVEVENEDCCSTFEADYHASYVLSDEESDDDEESTPSTFGFVPAKFPTTSASAAVNNATLQRLKAKSMSRI
ncbi:hypothetical protein BKA70DRAFT_1522259 [Coprinopsis sp. MPI-PUGE-AT-0042]|nr:hypothetical protein BKA70DRAFT_1522259 [Coprinopsis sp. MPI-PUGE-AT-0042]